MERGRSTPRARRRRRITHWPDVAARWGSGRHHAREQGPHEDRRPEPDVAALWVSPATALERYRARGRAVPPAGGTWASFDPVPSLRILMATHDDDVRIEFGAVRGDLSRRVSWRRAPSVRSSPCLPSRRLSFGQSSPAAVAAREEDAAESQSVGTARSLAASGLPSRARHGQPIGLPAAEHDG
jgi:hypothetical protein